MTTRLDSMFSQYWFHNGASVWIAPLEMDSPGAGVENVVGVSAAYKGPLKGHFKGSFKGCIWPSEGSDGRNAEL